MKNPSKSIIQRGFSLIEMVVVLSIIAVLAVLVTTQFSGESAKATKILHTAEAFKKATQRFKMDSGLVPCDVSGLWDSSLPKMAADCAGGGATWSGPYIEKYDSASQEYNVQVARRSLPFAGLNSSSVQRSADVVVIPNIHQGLARELMNKCTGNDSMGHWGDSRPMANFADGKCFLEDWGGDPGPFTLYYLIDVVR